MTRIHAVDDEAGKALFEIDDCYVVVDTTNRDVLEVSGDLESLTASAWLKVSPALDYPSVWKELAQASVSSLDVSETETGEAAERKFRIPLSVKTEALQSVDWVRTNGTEFVSSGSIEFAHKIIDNTYLGVADVTRMQRFFARVPTSRFELSGWNPDSEDYPSLDRVKFGLRGGSAGKTWIEKITVKHSIVASATEVDGNAPHQFAPGVESPESCTSCGRDISAEQHVVVASAFTYDGSCDYFGHGLDAESTLVDALYVMQPDGSWANRENNDWTPMDPPAEDDIVILLDEESAYKLADVIDDGLPDNPDALPFELSMINPHEAGLFALAYPEVDWEMVDRVFDIYDSTERSVNAKSQMRGPGGKFGGDGPEAPDATQESPAQTKARLPQALPLVPDIASRIAQFLEANGGAAPAPAPGDDPTAVTAAFLNSVIDTFAPGDPVPVADAQQPADPAAAAPAEAPAAAAPQPLYLAIVDKVDTAAVLDVVSLMPGNPPVMWKRDKGQWIQAPEILTSMQSASPPPVVELTDPAVVQNVLEQVDKSTSGQDNTEEAPAPGATEQAPDGSSGPKPDANPDQHPVVSSGGLGFGGSRANLIRRGFSMPDGSYPIVDTTNLRDALSTYEQAPNPDATREHIVRRARALHRADLLPAEWRGITASATAPPLWGPSGEQLNLTSFAEGGADQNRGHAEQLRHYWVSGEGGLKIKWGTPGDLSRCHKHLTKYLGPERSWGYCQLRHKDATGRWNNADRD